MDEDFFQSILDENARGSATHAIFADWLADRGDPRAAGYCWMATHSKRPCKGRRYRVDGACWDWWRTNAGGAEDLPVEIWERLLGGVYAQARWREYPTRQAAEEALCRVIQEEVLNG